MVAEDVPSDIAHQRAADRLCADADRIDGCLPSSVDADVYRLLVERTQAPLFVTLDGAFWLVNPKLAELFGYTIEEMMTSLAPIELTDEADRPLVLRAIEARSQGTPDQPYEINCVRKDRSVFSARIAGTRISIAGRSADLVNLTDIDEVKTATRVAQRQAQLLGQAEELARTGSAETDLRSRTIQLSVGMYRIFGEPFSPMPVTSDWFFARVPPDDFNLFLRKIRQPILRQRRTVVSF